MPRKVIPESLSLYPFQQEAVQKLRSVNSALLADEMGLGKTPQAIVLSNVHAPQHTVIICPAVVRPTWEKEIQKWDTLKRKVLLVSKGNQKVQSDVNIIIISYDLASSIKWAKFLISYLHEDPKSMLICDEAHALKSWNAKRTKVIINKLSPHANKLLMITGTPITKSVEDLHPLLTALRPNEFGKKLDFCYRYAFAYNTPFGSGVEFRGVKNVEELKERMSPFMLRRFKQEVLKDLPSKTHSNVWLDIDSQVAKESLKVLDHVLIRLQEEGFRTDMKLAESHVATVKKNLGVAKLKPLIAWLDNYLETNTNEPLVIFCYHHVIVEALLLYFEQRNIKAVSITGLTSAKDREKAVTSFQAGHAQIFIGNIIAAGTGITLTRASTCILAELDWTPANIAQAIDRIHRITQVNPVMVYYMLAKDSLDEHIIDIVQQKIKDIDSVLGLDKGNQNDLKYKEEAVN